MKAPWEKSGAFKTLLSVVTLAILAIITGWVCKDLTVEVISIAGIAVAIGFFGGFLGKFMDGYTYPFTKEDLANFLIWTARVVYCATVIAVIWWWFPVSPQLIGCLAIACFIGILAGHWIWNPADSEPDSATSQPKETLVADLTELDEGAGR